MAEYTDEDFAAAARYVRHDFGRATVASVLEEFGMKRPDKPEDPEKEGDPKAPPEKTPEEKAAEKPKKRGIWWPAEAEKSE